MSSTVKMLKKDALVPITIGTGFIQKLQSMLMSLIADRTEEEINLLQQLAEQEQELPEPWMEHIQLLMVLLNELDASAQTNGFVIEKSVDELTTESDS